MGVFAKYTLDYDYYKVFAALSRQFVNGSFTTFS